MKRIVAILAAFVIAVGSVVGVEIALPGQGQVDDSLEYGYICSGTKSASIDFVSACTTQDTYYLFGSSELATMPEMVLSAPENVFRSYDCDIQLMSIGDAYDQSLWHSIALAAYAPKMSQQKVMLIVSPGWFFDGGLEPGIFKMRFSSELYKALCSNPAVSDESKEYIRSRLIQEGIGAETLDAASPVLPQDVINDAVFTQMNDLTVRNDLRLLREDGLPRVDTTTLPAPDFMQLKADAAKEGATYCTNNSYNVYDSYWTDYLLPRYESARGSMLGETMTDTPEYDDLRCLFDICRECGIQPYVVSMPINGEWYDYAGLSAQTRAAYYESIVALCGEYGYPCLDGSSHEYDPYYLRDIMHLGWTGWADVEQGFYSYVKEGTYEG